MEALIQFCIFFLVFFIFLVCFDFEVNHIRSTKFHFNFKSLLSFQIVQVISIFKVVFIIFYVASIFNIVFISMVVCIFDVILNFQVVSLFEVVSILNKSSNLIQKRTEGEAGGKPDYAMSSWTCVLCPPGQVSPRTSVPQTFVPLNPIPVGRQQ